MRKALTITLVAALALIVSGAAYANYCARDVVPASTLLVPFARQTWNFDTDTPVVAGYHTILSVTNVSSDAQIIHIMVWSPLSEVVLDFDQVLSGYDQWIFDMRDMLDNNPGAYATSFATDWKANVDLPIPAFAGPDRPSKIKRETFEWGPDGRTPFTFETALDDPEATSILDDTDCYVDLTEIPGPNFTNMVSALEGAMINRIHDGCSSVQPIRAEFNDTWTKHIADIDELWFYVTVDVVEKCGVEYPGSQFGYFDGVYKNANVLIGDVIYLNSVANYSEAMPAVHIETEPYEYFSTPIPPYEGTAAYLENFYEEKAIAADLPYLFTEPLGTAFAFRYAQIYADGPPITDIKSNVIVWKNQDQIKSSNGHIDDCGDYLYFSWDADEHSLSRFEEDCPVSPCYTAEGYDPNIFPFETQIVPVTTKNFDLPDMYGWILVVFSPSYPDGFVDPTTQSATERATQAWFGVQFTYGGYSAAMEAATLANANCFEDQVLPMVGIDYDYGFVTE
jgi:hypothetical protein